MFFRPGLDDHGLPHNPFKAMVSPRPIGWISTMDGQGRANLAPYSFFNAVSDTPPMVMLCSNGGKADREDGKDTVSIIRETGEFVCNIVSYDLRDAMNATSGNYEAGEDEFDIAGLEKAPCQVVKAPRVAAAPAALECRLHQVIPLISPLSVMVIGEVVGIHIDEAMLVDGIFEVLRYKPLSRLGYMDYAAVTETFSLKRPG
ncbi:flavin reductase family protein [Halovulum sp. GXIMD14793]